MAQEEGGVNKSDLLVVGSEHGKSFIEIRRHKTAEDDKPPRLVEVYVALVEPQQCRSMLKHLSYALPLGLTTTSTSLPSKECKRLDLSHLKRVRKTINKGASPSRPKTKSKTAGGVVEDSSRDDTAKSSSSSPDQNSPSKKKQRKSDQATDTGKSDPKATTAPLLEILLRDVESLEREYTAMMTTNTSSAITEEGVETYLQQAYGKSCTTTTTTATNSTASIVKRWVPGRPPESHQEWQDFQRDYWPSLFFPQKSKEHLEEQLQLTSEDIAQMKLGMEHALRDSAAATNNDDVTNSNNESNLNTLPSMDGAIVLDPSTSQVVSRASQERRSQLQQQQTQTTTDKKQVSVASSTILNNPLATSIVLAIQGVSRQERQKAISSGMGSSEFQKGQYLCNGFDLYTTHEPTVFEAMSLVHSRIRRVVYGCAAAGGGDGIEMMQIHALPSTNHNYRAFVCRPGSDLCKQCQD